MSRSPSCACLCAERGTNGTRGINQALYKSTGFDPVALAEDALPGFEVTAWDGWWAPAGTPKDIIATLNAAARKALADPQLRDALLKSGAEPPATSPEELGAFVESELPRWGKAVEQSGAKVE